VEGGEVRDYGDYLTSHHPLKQRDACLIWHLTISMDCLDNTLLMCLNEVELRF
jgi:hypothetical protein